MNAIDETPTTVVEASLLASDNEVLPLVFRHPRAEDWNLISHSFEQSLAFTTRRTRPTRQWRTRRRAELSHWRKRGFLFMVAAAEEDEDFIVGWGCADVPVLHYMFVKLAFRRIGVARSLVAAMGMGSCPKIFAKLRTPYARRIARAHPFIEEIMR